VRGEEEIRHAMQNPVIRLAYGWDDDNLIEEAPSQVLNAGGYYDEQPGRLLYVVCDQQAS